MNAVGKLVINGQDVAALDDRGVWSPLRPESAPTAALLNATEHPARDRQVGDSHQPWGVACLQRAARRLGANVVLSKQTPPPPTEGVM